MAAALGRRWASGGYPRARRARVTEERVGPGPMRPPSRPARRVLTLLWGSMACSSRSLICCGDAGAAVIAWARRGGAAGQRAGGLRRGRGSLTRRPPGAELHVPRGAGEGGDARGRRKGEPGPGLGPGAPPPPEEEEEPPEPPPPLPPPREPNSSELPPRGALWVTRAARSVGATLRWLGDGAGGDAGAGQGHEQAPPPTSRHARAGALACAAAPPRRGSRWDSWAGQRPPSGGPASARAPWGGGF